MPANDVFPATGITAMKTPLAYIGFLCGVLAGSAGAVTFVNGDTANPVWTLEKSPAKCLLAQKIPGWGRAEFAVKSGKEPFLELTLYPIRPFSRKGIMTFREEAPEWRPGVRDQEYGPVKIYRDFPGYLRGEQAWYALSSLERGLHASFVYRDDRYYRNEDIRVLLSPYEFGKFNLDFQECQTGLLDYGLSDVRYLTLHFDGKSQKLTPYSRDQLGRLRDYLKADPDIWKSVVISVFTDSTGTDADNQKLTETQAGTVSGFLKEGGIPEDKIVTRSFGENHQGVLNEIEADRKTNRRVIVEVRTEYDN